MGGTSDAGANPDSSGPLAPRQSSTSDIENFFRIWINDTWGPSYDALASIVVKWLALEQVVRGNQFPSAAILAWPIIAQNLDLPTEKSTGKNWSSLAI